MAEEIAAEEETMLGRYIAAHDKIIRHCYYSPEADFDTNNAYSAVMKHETMCVGYSLAYQMLSNRLGGDTISCYGFTDAEDAAGLHNWNLSRYGDKWYHVDITWDDGSYKSDSEVHDPLTLAEHVYFMRAEEKMDHHEVYSFAIPSAEEDLSGVWPEAATEEALREMIRLYFAGHRPAEGEITGIRLEAPFDRGDLTSDDLGQLVLEAFNRSEADYSAEWIYLMQNQRFFLQVYPFAEAD